MRERETASAKSHQTATCITSSMSASTWCSSRVVVDFAFSAMIGAVFFDDAFDCSLNGNRALHYVY